MDTSPESPLGERASSEKRAVAFSSVVAAVALTVIKIIVGIATGSLGILSEAAHSGLDLVAAVVTFFAVKYSTRPADVEHPYGHGKIENLSALFETLLLLATCVWIVIEAVERLVVKEVKVDASFWAFLVMAVSIVVNISRTRALSRVAKKYGSQALEADALHFQTDIWSSIVVIVGLVLVLLGDHLGVPWLAKADPVAALGVAALVVWVSYKLGRKTTADLLDAVPPGVRDRVNEAIHLPGVASVRRLRIRRSGPESFVDAILGVEPATSVEDGHRIASAVEDAVRQVLPGADVVVHVEPASSSTRDLGSLPALVRQVASGLALGAHDIHVHDVMGKHTLEVHLEVSESLTVRSAHEKATEFEASVREGCPGLEVVTTHIEPARGTVLAEEAPSEEAVMSALVARIARELDGLCRPHDIEVHREGGDLHVSLHLVLAAETGIVAAHEFSENLERTLISRIPGLQRVVIHVEPPEEARTSRG